MAEPQARLRCGGWSSLLLDPWRSEQHARGPLSALIDPRAEHRDLVRCQRGESLKNGLGWHFRLGYLTGHVVDQRTLLAAATGGGVHHIAVAATNFDETLAAEAKRGNDLVLSCELKGKPACVIEPAGKQWNRD
jgi:hypothetical protein